jgi:hypothetical protein
MSVRMNGHFRLLAIACISITPPLAAQDSLPEAAERAKQAWLAHDPQALVGQSPSIVLQIPGADPSSPLGRAQAVELLRRYMRSVEERGLDVTVVREVEQGKGFVELTRRYVVAGTTELRRETLFLGFRWEAGRWALAELRSAP